MARQLKGLPLSRQASMAGEIGGTMYRWYYLRQSSACQLSRYVDLVSGPGLACEGDDPLRQQRIQALITVFHTDGPV